MPDTAPSRPDTIAARCEMLDRIESAMECLPFEQREMIVLHLKSKMTFREIATLKGISINTATSRYRYGLDKLQSALDGQL